MKKCITLYTYTINTLHWIQPLCSFSITELFSLKDQTMTRALYLMGRKKIDEVIGVIDRLAIIIRFLFRVASTGLYPAINNPIFKLIILKYILTKSLQFLHNFMMNLKNFINYIFLVLCSFYLNYAKTINIAHFIA